MAPADEYTQALDKALSELEQDIKQRHLLNANIAGRRATVRVLSTLVPMNADKQRQVAQLLAMADYSTPNLTDEIGALLTRVYPKEMTAIEVRNALEESPNGEDSNISLSACHAALKRMLADHDVEPGIERNAKATYRRVLKLDTARVFPNSYATLFGHDGAAEGSGALWGLATAATPENPNSIFQAIVDAEIASKKKR
jgi:hypothetical protein